MEQTIATTNETTKQQNNKTLKSEKSYQQPITQEQSKPQSIHHKTDQINQKGQAENGYSNRGLDPHPLLIPLIGSHHQNKKSVEAAYKTSVCFGCSFDTRRTMPCHRKITIDIYEEIAPML